MITESEALAMLHQQGGLPSAVFLHFLVILSLATCLFAIKSWHNSLQHMLLLPLTLVAGPFGAGISLLAAATYSCVPKTVSPSEWISSFFSSEKDKANFQPHERVASTWDDASTLSNVEPFQDILSGGTLFQKQMAIAKISQYFRPQFAPLLLQAAQDPNAAVRVQAATALARIESHFMAQCVQLEKIAKNLSPQDFGRLQLAQLYDDYAHAGLLDESNRQSLRTKAIALYETYLKFCDDPLRQMLLARLYVRHNQPEKTCALLELAVESGKATPSALLWYMEALFRLRDFTHLRQLAYSYGQQIPISDPEQLDKTDALIVWSEEAPLLHPLQEQLHVA